jgi:hypothetical protein
VLPHDPNTTEEIRKRGENGRNAALYDALEVAKVLSELGDPRGYELAATAAFEGAWELHRAQAVRVLAEIAKTEKEVLEKNHMEPLVVLRAVADSEKSSYVFSALLSSACKLPHDDAISVLARAQRSAYQPEEKRKLAQSCVKLLEARKKARVK